MRALSIPAFGGPDVLEVVEAPIPVPGRGGIRVRVRACGVNPFDWKQRRGLFGGTPPIRVGVEVAGTVDAVGAELDGLAVGDPVYGFAVGGGAAQYAVCLHWAPMPVGLSFATAAAMPVAIETAYRVLDLLPLRQGTILLVNGGSGAVGQAIVQLAIARGVEVLATGSAANFSLLSNLGATPLAYGPGLAGRVRALGVRSLGAAVDAGGGDALADLVALTGEAQRVVTIVPSPEVVSLGVQISGGNSAFHGLVDIAAMLKSGQYRPPETRTYRLEEAAEAQRRSETGHLSGHKLVLIP